MAESKSSPKANPTEAAKPDATQSEKAKGQPVRVSYSPKALDQVVYADGVQGVVLSAGVAHLELYQVIPAQSATQAEQRIITHRVALPMTALGELARIINNVGSALNQAAQNGGGKNAKEEKLAG